MQLPEQSPAAKGKILDHGAGIGGTDEEMVEQRARELAVIAGLGRDESVDDFRKQAREELQGAVDPNVPNDDAGPMAEIIARDEVIGESGGSVALNGFEDEETVGEQLYNEGIEEADHDRMIASRRNEQEREET